MKDAVQASTCNFLIRELSTLKMLGQTFEVAGLQRYICRHECSINSLTYQFSMAKGPTRHGGVGMQYCSQDLCLLASQNLR